MGKQIKNTTTQNLLKPIKITMIDGVILYLCPKVHCDGGKNIIRTAIDTRGRITYKYPGAFKTKSTCQKHLDHSCNKPKKVFCCPICNDGTSWANTAGIPRFYKTKNGCMKHYEKEHSYTKVSQVTTGASSYHYVEWKDESLGDEHRKKFESNIFVEYLPSINANKDF